MKSTLAFTSVLVATLATVALLSRSVLTTGTAPRSPDRAPRSAMHDTDVIRRGGFAPDEEAVGKTTGVFVPNLGQVSHDVYFEFIGSDRVAHFRATSIGLLPGRQSRVHDESALLVDVRFVGANHRPAVRATKLADARLRYTVRAGTDQAFTASVPLFSGLTYTGLYEGVDLHVVADGKNVVRRFVVKAGVPVGRLLMHYDRADAPILLGGGSLRIPTRAGMLRYAPPTAYQERDGSRVNVPVQFSMGRYGAFGFRTGAYDPALPLVIEVEGV